MTPIPSDDTTTHALALDSDLMVDALAFHSAGDASEATQRAHASDMACFRGWCDQRGVDHLPASRDVVALYLTWCVKVAGLSVATVKRRMSTISRAHTRAGEASPVDDHVRQVVAGISRKDRRQEYRAPAITRRDQRAMLDALDMTTVKGVRDAAILLLGIQSGMRRSEIVDLELADLDFDDQGVTVHIRRSKTDQHGIGRSFQITRRPGSSSCAVDAVESWLRLSGVTSGAVFRSVNRWGHVRGSMTSQSISLVIKGAAAAAGVETPYSAHSLRSTLVTRALASNVHPLRIAARTGHRSMASIQRYDRRLAKHDADLDAVLDADYEE
jgi:integrase